MKRSIGFWGLFALGASVLFGCGIVMLTSSWLTRAGGPVNVIIALILCLLLELPLTFAYLEAISMFPFSGGELIYSYVAFGRFWGFMAAWFGILMSITLLCWEAIVINRVFNYLFPSLTLAPELYTVGNTVITLQSILISLSLCVSIIMIQIFGANLSSNVSKVTTSLIFLFVVLGAVLGLNEFNSATFFTVQTKSMPEGTVSLLALLPFSVAGWEVVAKTAGEAKSSISFKKVGLALILGLVLAIVMYILVVVSVSGAIPWNVAAQSEIPFTDLLVNSTGNQLWAELLLFVAILGVIGVYNGSLFGGSRMLYGLAKVGLIPKWFDVVSPKTGTPVRCVLFIGAFSLVVPFIGAGAFTPLANITAVETIAMWVMTFYAVLVLRRKYPALSRPIKMPGGKFTTILGALSCLFLLGASLLPFSPGAIVWPTEYIILATLFLLGAFLYRLRDKSIDEAQQRAQILGDAADIIRNVKSKKP